MTEKEAHEAADSLLSKMKTKGWKKRVWNNLGWCYCIEQNGIGIYLHRDGHTVYLNSDGRRGGSDMFWNIDEYFKDPNDAVTAQMKEAQSFIDGCQSVLDNLKESFNQ